VIGIQIFNFISPAFLKILGFRRRLAPLDASVIFFEISSYLTGVTFHYPLFRHCYINVYCLNFIGSADKNSDLRTAEQARLRSRLINLNLNYFINSLV